MKKLMILLVVFVWLSENTVIVVNDISSIRKTCGGSTVILMKYGKRVQTSLSINDVMFRINKALKEERDNDKRTQTK